MSLFRPQPRPVEIRARFKNGATLTIPLVLTTSDSDELYNEIQQMVDQFVRNPERFQNMDQMWQALYTELGQFEGATLQAKPDIQGWPEPQKQLVVVQQPAVEIVHHHHKPSKPSVHPLVAELRQEKAAGIALIKEAKLDPNDVDDRGQTLEDLVQSSARTKLRRVMSDADHME